MVAGPRELAGAQDPLDSRGARALLTIRDARPDEAETLFAIQKAASLAGLAHIFPPDRYPYPDDAIRTRWREIGGRVFLVERDGVPVGVAAVDDRWLNGLYVMPDEWGTGVANALHDAAVAEVAVQHDEAKLWVLEHNARARRFYERRGWCENGERRAVPFPPHPIDVGYSKSTRA
jgi:GNAT superfamily N-acetyltransferase